MEFPDGTEGVEFDDLPEEQQVDCVLSMLGRMKGVRAHSALALGGVPMLGFAIAKELDEEQPGLKELDRNGFSHEVECRLQYLMTQGLAKAGAEEAYPLETMRNLIYTLALALAANEFDGMETPLMVIDQVREKMAEAEGQGMMAIEALRENIRSFRSMIKIEEILSPRDINSMMEQIRNLPEIGPEAA